MKNLIAITLILIGQSAFAQTFTNYTTADGLLNDNVNALDSDASNTLWFGTQSGLSQFDGTTWTDHTTTSDPGFIDNNVLAVHCMVNGDVWIGTDFGASIYSGGSWTSYTNADGLANNQIKCISEDATGNVWFGTNVGASKFDGTTWTNIGTAQGLPFGGVVSIEEHSNGDMWLGTGLSGIRLYNGTLHTVIDESSNGLIDNRIRAMVLENNGFNWVATADGITVLNNLNMFQTNYTTIFTLPPPDTLNPIEDIKANSQGHIWVGVYVDYLVTEGGVCAYNGQQWFQFEVADGLVGPVVRQLAIDGNDDVWVATSTGVSKISFPNLGTNKLEYDQTFNLYPNPTSGSFTIAVNENSIGEKLSIYNAQMQLVQYEILSNEKLTLPTDKLNAGVYFVVIGGQTERLIVK